MTDTMIHIMSVLVAFFLRDMPLAYRSKAFYSKPLICSKYNNIQR